MSFERLLSGLDVGEQRVGSEAEVDLALSVTTSAPILGAILSDTFPSSWTVLDAGGGEVVRIDQTTSRLTWPARDLRIGATLQVRYRLLAPEAARTARGYSFQAELTYPEGLLAEQPQTITVGSPVVVDHFRFGKDRSLNAMEWYAATDTPPPAMPRFEAFRVRFQVSNRDTLDATWQPRLEWSVLPAAGFQPLLIENPREPFYVRKSKAIADGEVIPSVGPGLGAGYGSRAAGRAYDATAEGTVQSIGPRSNAEIEFSVRATAAAAWQTTYYFRLTDGGRVLTGEPASLTISTAPALELTRPRYSGRSPSSGSSRASVSPAASDSLSLSASPAASGSLSSSASLAAPASLSAAAIAPTSDLTFASLTVSPAAEPLALAAAVTVDPASHPHGDYTVATDQCGACHRTHTAPKRILLKAAEPEPVSSLCFTCHNGTGARTNVQGDYSDPVVPANDSGSNSYYSHPATSGTGHVSGQLDQFGGRLNRKSSCTDCHSPHRSDPLAAPDMTASGWTVSGATLGAAGVGATNGSAGSVPSYTWMNGARGISYEYQLCFKCHSSYTTLLSSTWPTEQMIDKGAELNPANNSYHPVEAAGSNASVELAANLGGQSPYKLWNFGVGDVVRCLNCHGDYRKANPSAPPAAGGRLAPHTSRYRGLLMNNYENRLLKASSALYAATDFALCYQCHGEEPYRDTSGNQRADTSFDFHGFHLDRLSDNPGGGGSSRDIDSAGAGQGNAICAECHFRTHGTSGAVNADQRNNWRLVNFAPNVIGLPPLAESPQWSPASKSCTLTCHGTQHSGWGY